MLKTMNEYYVILDLYHDHQYIDMNGKLGVFKYAKEFYSEYDAGNYIMNDLPEGQYKIVKVFRKLY